MKLKKRIKFYFEYFFLFSFTFIVRLFPLKINLLFAKGSGGILYYFDKKHRQRAMDNLTRAFPEKKEDELVGILKNVYINLCKNYIEFLYIPLLNKKYYRKKIRVEGKENLDRALKQNKGIVAASSHLGNWELMGAVMIKNNYHLDALYHPMRNPYTDNFINRLREKAGMKLISMENSIRGSLRSLKQNHVLGMIADQDAGGDGVFVDFFKRPASTAVGPALFAARTGAPMLFFALIREKNDDHTLHITGPLDVKITNDRKKNIYNNTKLWSDELEKWVRKYPEQWFWVHRKWHSRPK